MRPIRFIRAMRPDDELPRRTPLHVRLKNLIRVVEVGNDDVELGKVIAQVFGQFPVPREETRQAPRLDGLHAIHQTARLRQLHDMGITQHFEMRLGKLLSQRGEGRQRENEIPDRAAANDEDFATHGNYIAPETPSSPSTTTSNANASRMALPIFTRCSVAVAQLMKSRNRHGEIVNQMPATTNT
jgi:hypothetical protein